MFETFDKWDKKIFLLINDYHNHIWDQAMIMVTNRFFWIPFYLFLCLLIVRNFGKQASLILIMIALVTLASDQLTSSVIKPLVHRLRPCHEFTDLHLPSGCGGLYGFVSSHASNTFALATFLFMLFKRVPVWGLMFLWAFTVSYSRVYLGVHYPGDIFAGALTGILLSILFFRIYRSILKYLISKNLFKQES